MLNIKKNKAQGNVNRITTRLNERLYVKHFFKAAKLIREALWLGGLLTNSESWINIKQKDLSDSEKPNMFYDIFFMHVSAQFFLFRAF